MTDFEFAECVLRVNQQDRYIETVFRDGCTAPARPNWTDDDIERAHELGYAGDCWQMCLDHEALHTLVGELRGFGRSVILWNVAHGGGKRWPEQGREEEGYVTSLQRALRRGQPDDLVRGLCDQARQTFNLYPQQVMWLAHGLSSELRKAA